MSGKKRNGCLTLWTPKMVKISNFVNYGLQELFNTTVTLSGGDIIGDCPAPPRPRPNKKFSLVNLTN